MSRLEDRQLGVATDLDRLFAVRLRAIREARGLSGQQLGEHVGLTQGQIYDIEVGLSRTPQPRRRRKASLGEAVALCRALRVSLDQVLDPAHPIELLIRGSLPNLPAPARGQ